MATGGGFLDIGIDTSELSVSFRGFVRRFKGQIPFAVAKSLTSIARQARDEVRDELRDHFTIRAKRRMRSGIRFERAEKRDWPNPTAVVGALDKFMALHATGGVKRAFKSSNVVIPARWVARKRTTTGKIPKRLTPARVIARGGTFEDRTLKKKQGRRAKGRNLSIHFIVRKRVKIPKRWPFVETVRRVHKQHYRNTFIRNFRLAAQTARSRG